MKIILKKPVLIGVLFALFAAATVAEAAIAVLPQPGVSNDVKFKVAKTVSQFNDILEREMKVRLTRDITIYLCPDTSSYRRTLETTLGISSTLAQSAAKISSGFANNTHQAIAIKFNPESAANFDYRAYTVTAHELFHEVQYQLSADNSEKTQKWLREGTADLIGAIIAEKIGYESLEKWKADRLNALRRAKATVKPADILHVGLEKWNRYVEDGLLPYQVSDLMVFYLMTKTRGNLEPIAIYFTLAATSRDDGLNFTQAFGISLDTFLPAFESWLADALDQPAKIEVLSEGTGDTAKIQKVAAASQLYFREHFGTVLRSNVRIVVAADKAAYAAALGKQFGIDTQEAQRLAGSSTWRFSGSTTVVNIAGFKTEGDMAYLLADSLALRLAHETASQPLLETVYWLYFGGAEIVGLKIAENLGYTNALRYPGNWRTDIKKSGRPALAEITSKQGWKQAAAAYGQITVQKTARLAALFLIEKHGVGSLHRWYQRTKETQNARQAFADIFGKSPEALETEFVNYLNRVGGGGKPPTSHST